MEQYEKNIIPQIESIYNSFTPLEKTIADFFISNTEKTRFILQKCIQSSVCVGGIPVTFCEKVWL